MLFSMRQLVCYRYVLFLCVIAYTISLVETSNSALFLEDDRSGLSEVAAELVDSEAE